MKKLNLKLLGKRVLIKPLDPVKKFGILHIPEQAQERPAECEVVGVGNKVSQPIKPGDRVIVSKYGGSELKVDGEEFKICQEDEILCILH